MVGFRKLTTASQRQVKTIGIGELALQLQPANTTDPVHLSLDVSDIRGFVDELQHKGVRLVEPIKRLDFGDSALIADPSGNVIGLIDLSASKVPHD